MFLASLIKIPDDLQDKLNTINKIRFSSRNNPNDNIRYMKKPTSKKNKTNIDKIQKENNSTTIKNMTNSDLKTVSSKLKSIPLNKTFHELLFEFIDNSGLTDPQIYFRASIDRRLFSKIRSDVNYHPSFGTITLLALALRLSTDDYKKLLASASYSLSSSSYSGVTLKYCFDNKIYDVIYVNNLVYTVTGKEIRELI